MRHHVRIAFAVPLALAFALGARGAALRILCTTTIVGDVVRAVAGPEALVTVLVPPGVDPHTFQPAPGDARAIEEADLAFQSGAGLEASFATILSAARGPVIDLSAGLALRGRESEARDDAHALVDPHVWFDPYHVAAWVRAIESALTTADPAQAEQFAERAAAYRAELEALDAWIREATAELAPENRQLVTDHEVFAYFAARYGFEQIGTVFPGTSTLSEPSARDEEPSEHRQSDRLAKLDARCRLRVNHSTRVAVQLRYRLRERKRWFDRLLERRLEVDRRRRRSRLGN